MAGFSVQISFFDRKIEQKKEYLCKLNIGTIFEYCKNKWGRLVLTASRIEK